MSENVKPMTVAEVREGLAKGKVITLPSGLVMRVRRLTPYDYIKEGITDIPNEFHKFVADLQEGRLDLKKNQSENLKHLETFEKFVNTTIQRGVIEPPMIFKYEQDKIDTHLLYTELSGLDQAVLLGEIIGR